MFVNKKIRQFEAAGGAEIVKKMLNPLTKKRCFYHNGLIMVITMMKKIFFRI